MQYIKINFVNEVGFLYLQFILVSAHQLFISLADLFHLQVILSSDVELNPGPKPSSGQKFSVCHWNLKSIPTHNFSKISLLSAYNSLHMFDIICLSETYLYSTILPQDPNLEMQGYTLIRVDHYQMSHEGEPVFIIKTISP